jgi:hypothetical protein
MQQRHQKSLRLFRFEKFILTRDPGSALHRSYLLQSSNVALANLAISDVEYERLLDKNKPDLFPTTMLPGTSMDC